MTAAGELAGRYRVDERWPRVVIGRSGEILAIACDSEAAARHIAGALNVLTAVSAQAAHIIAGIAPRLAEERRVRELTLREAAEQIGVSRATLDRIEHGEDYVVSNAVRILTWLASPRPPLT